MITNDVGIFELLFQSNILPSEVGLLEKDVAASVGTVEWSPISPAGVEKSLWCAEDDPASALAELHAFPSDINHYVTPSFP